MPCRAAAVVISILLFAMVVLLAGGLGGCVVCGEAFAMVVGLVGRLVWWASEAFAMVIVSVGGFGWHVDVVSVDAAGWLLLWAGDD